MVPYEYTVTHINLIKDMKGGFEKAVPERGQRGEDGVLWKALR